jgi:hypothetical protein
MSYDEWKQQTPTDREYCIKCDERLTIFEEEICADCENILKLNNEENEH